MAVLQGVVGRVAFVLLHVVQGVDDLGSLESCVLQGYASQSKPSLGHGVHRRNDVAACDVRSRRRSVAQASTRDHSGMSDALRQVGRRVCGRMCGRHSGLAGKMRAVDYGGPGSLHDIFCLFRDVAGSCRNRSSGVGSGCHGGGRSFVRVPGHFQDLAGRGGGSPLGAVLEHGGHLPNNLSPGLCELRSSHHVVLQGLPHVLRGATRGVGRNLEACPRYPPSHGGDWLSWRRWGRNRGIAASIGKLVVLWLGGLMGQEVWSVVGVDGLLLRVGHSVRHMIMGH